jgi:hypothetical protein
MGVEANNFVVSFTRSYILLLYSCVKHPYRNAPNTAPSGPSTGTGLAAQPPSPVLDRHAQQAYYAPRAVHSPPSGGDNNHVLDLSLPPSSVERDLGGVPPTGGRPASNIDPGSTA